MLITHENFRIYCHFYNNEKTCPYDQECVFLHEESQICKYGTMCERNYCMFKHEKEEESDVSVSNEISNENENEMDEKNNEETVNNMDEDAENNEEYDHIEIVNVEEVNVAVVNIENSDDTRDASDDKIAGNYAISDKDFPFKCRMCDFASARKTELKNHKKTIHHWCFICFSSYTSQENLVNHFTNFHSTKQEDLDLALGKAPLIRLH